MVKIKCNNKECRQGYFQVDETRVAGVLSLFVTKDTKGAKSYVVRCSSCGHPHKIYLLPMMLRYPEIGTNIDVNLVAMKYSQLSRTPGRLINVVALSNVMGNKDVPEISGRLCRVMAVAKPKVSLPRVPGTTELTGGANVIKQGIRTRRGGGGG